MVEVLSFKWKDGLSLPDQNIQGHAQTPISLLLWLFFLVKQLNTGAEVGGNTKKFFPQEIKDKKNNTCTSGFYIIVSFWVNGVTAKVKCLSSIGSFQRHVKLSNFIKVC